MGLKMKKCNKCGEEKPATAEFFHRNKRRKDGVKSVCRECRNKKPIPPPPQPEDYERFRLQPNSEMKRCPQCEEWKPATAEFFHRRGMSSDGLKARCKECSYAYKTAHRDAFLERNRVAAKARAIKKKKRLVEYLGGECAICGYNKCLAAFDFHHINAEEKSFGVGPLLPGKKFEALLKEVKKCMLLCANCHRELHYNETEKKEAEDE